MSYSLMLTNQTGTLLRTFSLNPGDEIGLHSLFGWLSPNGEHSRARIRKINHHPERVREQGSEWLLRTKIAATQTPSFRVEALQGCTVKEDGKNAYSIVSPLGNFKLALAGNVAAVPAWVDLSTEVDKGGKKIGLLALLLLLLSFSALYFLKGVEITVKEPELPIPVAVIQVPEKTVQVKKVVEEKAPIETKDKKLKVAIHQNLGFLGLLGKKNLKGALGGMPTQLEKASAGAGPGGLEGSGGEVLAGLGQGVKRTTVGNTGTAGLGGIGTKGAGGGLGGYGNSAVGSGEGKALSALPLSKDLVLDGGLDRAVVLATIAKYQSQVRACYQAGLAHDPSLAGLVTMQFEINGEGNLNFARVAKSTLGETNVENCISTRMMGWRFPKPVGGVKVPVLYPFNLRPVKG